MYHHQIAGQDTGVQHGLTPDPQGEILPLPPVGVKGQVVLDALLRQNRRTGSHRTHDGNAAHRRLRLLRYGGRRGGRAGTLQRGQRQSAALSGALGQNAQLLHVLQMKVNGGRGAQTHSLADLPHRGGISLLPCGLRDVIVDLLLHFGQLCHVDAPFFRRKPDGFVILYHTVPRIATFVLSFSPEKAQKILEDPLHCLLCCGKIVCTVNRVPFGTEYMWRFPL